ncbi:MAG: class I SAM-dependent methyltransferase [Candidatus Omnitrophota bacterium]|nr:class I SAM-dependent methyltransferase [Candidatus Omnitrophota bacterium]
MIAIIKKCLKKVLTPKQIKILRNSYKHLKIYLKSYLYSKDLQKLATLYGTDKWNRHWYAQHYQKHFCHLRKQKLNILEIGAGGEEDPARGGNSLRMWKRYFPNSVIYSIDIYDKALLQEKRIEIFRGNQNDPRFLKDVFNNIGSLDIVIDDGSHINEHVITAFKTLFPLLNNGGIYVIEDLQASYYPEYGGDSENLNNPNTTMNFFKSLTDCLNHVEFLKAGCVPSYFDKNIIAIYFYHSLAFIFKGINDEKSTSRKTAKENFS